MIVTLNSSHARATAFTLLQPCTTLSCDSLNSTIPVLGASRFFPGRISERPHRPNRNSDPEVTSVSPHDSLFLLLPSADNKPRPSFLIPAPLLLRCRRRRLAWWCLFSYARSACRHPLSFHPSCSPYVRWPYSLAGFRALDAFSQSSSLDF